MRKLVCVAYHQYLTRVAQQTTASAPNILGCCSAAPSLGSFLSSSRFASSASDAKGASADDAQQRAPSGASSSAPTGYAASERPTVAPELAAASSSSAAAAASAPSPPTDAASPAAPASAQPDGSGDSPAAIAATAAVAAAAADDMARHAAVLHQLQQPQVAQLLQVVPTPEGAPRDKLLLRDFIQNSLYHPTLGYFSAATPPVGSVGGPINYWKIYCKDEFDILIKKKYQELETSFLTPAELFSPWYGACIARHMVEHRRHHLGMEGQPLHVVEVGGGNGTLARDVLDWLRDNRPAEYRQTTYTCLEISTSLAARQYDKVVVQGGHGGRFHLRRGSGLDPATWGGAPRWEHTFVLMMEVLDNLPHDRVFRRRANDPWQQAVIRPASSSSASSPSSSLSSAAASRGAPATIEHGPWEEAGEPLADPLVARTLAAVYRPSSREQQLDERFNRVLDFILARDAQPTSRDEVLWLPTAAAAFLELLHALRPNHSLIAADFDKLPDVKLPGRNAPLVAEKVGGRNIDHNSLFVPWGTADIFFPTDFDALCSLYRSTAEHVWGGKDSPAATSTTAAANSTTAAAAASGASAAASAPAAAGDADAAAAAAAAAAESSAVGDVNAEHFRQGAVIKRYREMFNTATICAFNPMVDDFVNARFFFGDSKNRFPPGTVRPALQTGPRLPTGPSSFASGIKSHIPAAPASKSRTRGQQQQQQVKQQAEEPVLGGKRRRGVDGAGGGGGGVGGGGGGGGGKGRGGGVSSGSKG